MRYAKLSTPLLIEKCAQKDPVAWAEFVTRFSPLINFSIKKALAGYLYDRSMEEEVKDIRQNIMVSLWNKNKLDEVRNRENINYWLAIVARNTAINYLKTKRKEILVGEESYFDKFAAGGADEAGVEERDKKIEMIYNLLTPGEKIVFTLCFKKGFSLKDASKILNLAPATVSATIARMRKKIKK